MYMDMMDDSGYDNILVGKANLMFVVITYYLHLYVHVHVLSR